MREIVFQVQPGAAAPFRAIAEELPLAIEAGSLERNQPRNEFLTWREELANFDLTVAAGERLLVAGASGSGKSTLARVIAGSLRLTVGYSVCCFVVIMGWLTHEQQLDSWIPLRLFWTAFGIIMALLSLRLFWPSRARIEQRQGLLQLLVDLGETLQEYLHNTPVAQRRRALTHRLRELRNNLLSLRDQRINALFGLQPCVRCAASNINTKRANTLARNLQRVAIAAWLQHKHGATCLRTLFDQRTRRVRTNFLVGSNQNLHLRHFANV